MSESIQNTTRYIEDCLENIERSCITDRKKFNDNDRNHYIKEVKRYWEQLKTHLNRWVHIGEYK